MIRFKPIIEDPNYAVGKLFYRRHPVNLLFPAFNTLLMLGGIWFLLAILSNPSFDPTILERYWNYVILMTGLALFFVLSYFLMQWVFWYFDIWVVTDEKLVDSQLVTFFLFNRAELPLRQVQDISFSTSGLLATLFRCGDITVQTASKQGSFKLLSIYQPQQAVAAIQRLVEAAAQEIYGAHDATHFTKVVRLGELLLGKNVITIADLTAALEEQKISHEKIGRILLHKGLITKQDLLSALSAQYHIPQVDLNYYQIDSQVLGCFTPELARKHKIIPVFKSPNGVLAVAVANLSEVLIKEVKDGCGMPVSFMLADEDEIDALIQKYYPLSG